MPPRTRNPPPNPLLRNKEGGGEENANDKRRKVGGGRMTGPTAASQGRQVRPVLSTVSLNRQDTSSVADTVSEMAVEEIVDFTKEDVEALLNEKIKARKTDFKAKSDQLSELNKRFRRCVKWFQGIEQNLNSEKENLQNLLDCSEKKCVEIENARKSKEDELNAFIGELQGNNAALQSKFSKEESDKLEAIESYTSEKEARTAAETLIASLEQELEKVRQEKMASDHKEYNTSLQQYNSRLQTDLATANATLQRVEKEKSTIVENLGTLRGHYASLQEQLTTSRASQDEAVKLKETLNIEVHCLRGELQQVREDRDRLQSQIHERTVEIKRLTETTGTTVKELDNLMMKSNALEETCSSQRQQLQILQHQLGLANEKLKMADLSVSETRTNYEEQQQLIMQLKDRLAEAEIQIHEKELLRRKLHNTILELKGNIRVFCRVRPMLPEDGCSSDASVIAYPPSTEGHEQGIDLIQSGQKYAFTFDKVFTQQASQNDVFEEISELVQSALDGYKVCIFAYGQTGSGKTYTMMGRPESLDQKGLIPRSLEQIFETSQRLSAQGWKYHMQASVLEIYNETIRDLLASNRSSVDSMRTDSGVPVKQHAIKHDANGDTCVSDLTIVDVCSSKQVASLLQKAAQSRSIGKTQMNEQSSRSHFVFTLRISAVNETTEKHGVLNLIDLAGSERLSKSGSTGDQLKETQAINRSLSSLADVIFALAKKDNHVPFRNSKLTYLLQPCLSGDSKTLMFVNLSPEPTSVNESLCSLRFAARVNTCQIGVPRRQTAIRSADSRLSID
ncbi:kinesin-like protein KIN-14C isoform X2 [Silene latifolia]|uniref:kinesin-like protein KIN-14C isoform X2 n=1 Tax=Silene latifolia TaxID=37657 RepID=UPI003D7720D4